MREEVISSGGPIDHTPAASSVGASSPAVPTNINSLDWSCHGQNSKAASISCIGSQPPWTSLSGSALVSSRPSCRPWERSDLLRRLATFKPSNWFGKPKVTSSLACAQRGWINVDVDKLECESCGACLSSVSSSSWTPAEAEDAGEVFAKQLDIGHKAACPWRGSCCPESLAQFPPTPQSALIGGYKDRCDGLLQFQFLPLIASSAIEKMQISRGPQIGRLLSQFNNLIAGDSESTPEFEFSRDGASSSFSQAQKLISLCGWEPRWLPNVQDCEEHSAQSARNGYSFGPSQAQINLSQDHGPSRNIFSSARKDTGKNKLLAVDSRSELGSSLLDCSLCGATVRISDFSTVLRPTRFAPNNVDIPSKSVGLTRGASAASGINGWVAADDPEKEQAEDRDEVATTDKLKLLPNPAVDLNLTMAGGVSFARTSVPENTHDAEDIGRDLMIGQPAASYESRGPSSRKRSLEIGGSSDNRGILGILHADSVEGSVIDRDGDEVTDSAGPGPGPSTKRARDSDIFDTFSSYPRDSSGAGPSHSSVRDQILGIPSARDSTRASSVIAMNISCHSDDDDSMDSVENHPGENVGEIHFPSSSTHGNLDMHETSELNYSNQAQQSIHLREAVRVEMGVGSTNDGDENFNTETVTAQRRGGVSFGISGCSVGMCASHEAEIHGADFSVHRTHSVVGDVDTRIEDHENQGQTGDSVPDPRGDSQEMLSRSIGRADSASKVDGADSVESVEKASGSCKFVTLENNSPHHSLSCNANIYSGYETNNKEVTKGGKSSSMNNCPYSEPDYAMANGIGPPKGESNYGDVSEFDPILHHNKFCPWVDGNVAAAGSSSPSSGASDAVALCGWQLTLDALDVLRSEGNMPLQTGPSESAASLYKVCRL
ncbi:hypothetical protein ACFE04_011412 [Oxalis oulophora]